MYNAVDFAAKSHYFADFKQYFFTFYLVRIIYFPYLCTRI